MAGAQEVHEHGSAPYDPDNLLDRHSHRETLEFNYRYMKEREALLASQRLGLQAGTVLSVGAGWHPGRHLFPAPQFRLVAVDADPDRVAGVRESGRADEAQHGYAGRLEYPDTSFDAILYRLVLHHITYVSPLGPVFAEAARLLRPGGAMVVIEPNLWHPVGGLLALANITGAAPHIHGTPDDIPLSPRRLMTEARAAGLVPELHAVTFGWRRLPRSLQSGLRVLDTLGSRPRAAHFAHTLMMFARKPGTAAAG